MKIQMQDARIDVNLVKFVDVQCALLPLAGMRDVKDRDRHAQLVLSGFILLKVVEVLTQDSVTTSTSVLENSGQQHNGIII